MRNAIDLIPGEKAVIKSITDNELSLKLLEMGCIPGNEIQLKFVAPLGDPICILVEGYLLALRKEEASMIEIETANS